MSNPKQLVVVLGDQLDDTAPALVGFDRSRDAVWMAEAEEEATHVWCHKLRVGFFFSAMRHFRDQLREKGHAVHYHELTTRRSEDRGKDLSTILRKDLRALRPERVVMTMSGDHRVQQALTETVAATDVELEVLPDSHFYCSPEEFEAFAEGKKAVRMEIFYRWMRKRHRILVSEDGEPEGGDWNYDKENRESFGSKGPDSLPHPLGFPPDALTREVLSLVETRFRKHPGRLAQFDLPVTRRDAKRLMRHFVAKMLPAFGRYEDAMWQGEPFLYHSRLSSSLNLKLINPRECVDAAARAYAEGKAPLNSVEGFVRQILGWREYIRGVYWLHMPSYRELNFLNHRLDVPSFFWDGDTDLACVKDCMGHVLDHGYAHHIERLMVLGLLAQLIGVHPLRFHEWHLAMYVDAIDWVSLPNALGMSQFGDGGVVGSKPYCATGSYINRMGNHCRGCRYDPKQAIGENACPFTTLYWDFLHRHYETLRKNPRMGFQVRNLERKRDFEMKDISERAKELRRRWYQSS